METIDFPSTDDAFQLDAEKASAVLGVNKTRLSQLTSKGILPFERRRVDQRSRVFYRLSDLLSYQRKNQGVFLPQDHSREFTHELGASVIDDSFPLDLTEEIIKPKTILRRDSVFKKPKLTALEVRKQSEQKTFQDQLLEQLNVLSSLVLKQQDMIQKLQSTVDRIQMQTALKKEKSYSTVLSKPAARIQTTPVFYKINIES